MDTDIIQIKILLNGSEHIIKEGINLVLFISDLELEPKSLAIELNREIIPKSEWENTILYQGDKVEIVQFVGGGV